MAYQILRSTLFVQTYLSQYLGKIRYCINELNVLDLSILFLAFRRIWLETFVYCVVYVSRGAVILAVFWRA